MECEDDDLDRYRMPVLEEREAQRDLPDKPASQMLQWLVLVILRNSKIIQSWRLACLRILRINVKRYYHYYLSVCQWYDRYQILSLGIHSIVDLEWLRLQLHRDSRRYLGVLLEQIEDIFANLRKLLEKWYLYYQARVLSNSVLRNLVERDSLQLTLLFLRWLRKRYRRQELEAKLRLWGALGGWNRRRVPQQEWYLLQWIF